MALSQDTVNRTVVGLASNAAGTELVNAVNAPAGNIPAATITNAQLAPLALQSTGTLATGALGYATGAGGAVTQGVSRTTGVTLSKLSGQITTRNDSLGAELSAVFIVTNTLVAIGDVIALSIQSGSNGGNTEVTVVTVTNGTFSIMVSNNNAAGGTAETGVIIINYVVLKSVAA
jgi:hypothetical protein